MKEWNQNQFGNIHNNIARIEKDLNDFDKKKKEMTLTIEEMEASGNCLFGFELYVCSSQKGEDQRCSKKTADQITKVNKM